jgi:ferredoxin
MAYRIAKIQILRRVVLGVVLVGVTAMAYLHQKSAAFPSIDALDPFGGLETLLKFVAGGELIKKLEPGTLVLFGALIALGLVLGRFFCGWFCAFGALQGAFGWLGKKIFRRRFALPRRLDAVLRWAKYPVLAAVIYFTWRAGDLVIRPYDPMAAYGHLSTGLAALWAEFAVGLVLLVAVMVLSMLYERAFCKYLCPLGAVEAILSRVPFFRIKRIESTCISCSKCDNVCPMNIEVATAGAVDSPECIACLECVSVCPTKRPSLVASLGGKAVKAGLVVGIGFAVYLAAALVGQGLGMLSFRPATLQERAATGALAIADIKGSSTYASLIEAFGLEPARLFAELGIDPAKLPLDTMLKTTASVAGVAGFSVDSVRFAVAKLTGLPYAGETEAMAAPAAAAALGAAQKAAPAAPKAPAAQAAPAATAPAALAVPADFVLEGTMSVDDLAAALKASPEAVLAKLGLPADAPRNQALRDLKDRYGFTMPELKARIKE